MKNKKTYSLVAFFLAILMLISALPMGTVAFTGKAVDYRGAMSEDENGVLVYDELADYRVKSAKNTVLSTDYEILSAGSSTGTIVEKDTRYPNLAVDWALYYDMSIEGTTPVIRYGLSEMESVSYIDKDGTVTSGASPKELTASNGGDASFGGGYGTNEKGETTVYYAEKSILFYIINHSCGERLGTESDVSILTDYIEQGYLVVTLDYKNAPEATTPYIEQSLASAQNLFNRTLTGNAVSDLTDQYGDPIVTTDTYFYFIPEGCRLERDIWFYDASIWAIDGVMESYMDVWNTYYAGTKYDPCQIGKVSSVEELIKKVTQHDGETPLEYKRNLSIIYPSKPKDNYKAPLFLQEGTGYNKEGSSTTTNTVATSTGFALNGYATAQYDHALYPFIAHYQYDPVATGGGYGTRNDVYNNARAALRCVRYYADALGYNGDLVGIAGISKATNGTALLASVGNRDFQEALSGYDVNCNAGDVFAEGTERTAENRLKAVIQPFMTYENSSEEISTDTTCASVSAGTGVRRLFELDFKDYKKVPIVTSEGLRDPFACYDYFENLEAAYEEYNKENFLLIPQFNQGHTYAVGYDDYYDFERFEALLTFFDLYLKPDASRAPEVVWMTPTDGSSSIPVSGKWTVGPFTPYGWEMNTYERDQQIQVKFFDAVNPDSVSEGMVVRDADGKRIGGEWVSSQNDTMFTFVTSGLRAGMTYTIAATDKVLSKNGVPLEEEVSVTFATEGTYAIRPVADTYVSSLFPNKAYGNDDKILLDFASTALFSYSTKSIASASKITLSAFVERELNTSATVYALPNYVVDENALTYNALMASDAWAEKVSLGSYDLTSNELALDISSLSSMNGLGDYVTLVLVSNEPSIENAYVYHNDFEYAAGVEIKGTNATTGAEVTVLDSDGVLKNNPELENKIYSDYICSFSGNQEAPRIVEEDGSGTFRTSTTGSAFFKLFNTFKDSPFTEEDIGKVYRISLRLKRSVEAGIQIGLLSANAGEGTNDYTGPVSNYSTAYCISSLRVDPYDDWKEILTYVTINEKMVDAQVGLLGIWVWQADGAPQNYTWFDDVVIEECNKTRVTMTSGETMADTRVSLLTTNAEAVDFAEGEIESDSLWSSTVTPSFTAVTPANKSENVGLLDGVTITFDKAMNIATFKNGIEITNKTTGNVISGTWTALDDDGYSFAFTSSGFEPDSTYSVKVTEAVLSNSGYGCDEVVITTFTTAGDYAVRPLVSTYVSKEEPNKHYGLNTNPIIDASHVGVLTFSAKSLVGASEATLYLPLRADGKAKLEISAVADYVPDESFCYDTYQSLNSTKLTAVTAVDGNLTLDVSSLAALGAEETVTIFIKSLAFEYKQDFEFYTIGEAFVKNGKTIVDASGSVTDAGKISTSAEQLGNFGFSDYLWRRCGERSHGYILKDTALSDSQIFQVKTYSVQQIKFYSSLKDDYLTTEDIGKVYEVSFSILPAVDTRIGVGTMCAYKAAAPSGATPTSHEVFIPAGKYFNVVGGQWNDITLEIEVTEEMVKYQSSMFTVELSYALTVNGERNEPFTYFDNIVLKEKSATVTVNKNSAMLATVNDIVKTSPVVSTYVSKAEPSKNYGLNVTPIIDASHIGVLTFSAKDIAGADATLNLPLSTSGEVTLELSVVADYMPDEGFCYDTYKSLSSTKLTVVSATDGNLEIDVSSLASLGAEETVTIFIKSTAFEYKQDFEFYTIGEAFVKNGKTIVDASGSVTDAGKISTSAEQLGNFGFSDYLWRRCGERSHGYILKDTALSDSQIFQVKTYSAQQIKFYSSLKDDYLTTEDIGKVYEVSFSILPAADTRIGVGTMCAYKAPAPSGETPTSHEVFIPAGQYFNVTGGKWNDITLEIKVTEDMVKYQSSMFTVQLSYALTVNGERNEPFTYFDNIVLKEKTSVVSVNKGAAIVAKATDTVKASPVVATYVSKAEPSKNYGLDVTPIVDASRVGVLTFSAKELAGSLSTMLTLPLSTSGDDSIEVFAIADYMPDESFCYDAYQKLKPAKLTSVSATNGDLRLDASALADLDAKETVTIFIKSMAFEYRQDFEFYTIGEAFVKNGKTIVDASGSVTDAAKISTSAEQLGNFGFSDYLWRRCGERSHGYILKDTALSDSQIFQVKTYSAQQIKFYSSLKDDYLTTEDIGKVYEVSFSILPAADTRIGVGTMCAYKAPAPSGETPTSHEVFIPAGQYFNVTGGQWNDITLEIEVTEEMVKYQSSMFTVQLSYALTVNGERNEPFTYFDNIVVAEASSAVTVNKDTASLTTVHEGKVKVDLLDVDKPVTDKLPVVSNVDASVISYQVTKGEAGEFSIRLIAGIDSLAYEKFGYEITVTDAEGSRTRSGVDTRVYASIYGGETLYSIKDNFGYEYASLATVTGLALDSDFTELVVRTYVVTREGETRYGRGATLRYIGALNGEGYPDFSVEME